MPAYDLDIPPGMYASIYDDPAHYCQCPLCRAVRAFTANPRIYDHAGYDQFGYNRAGLDRFGFTHLQRYGYDVDGYNIAGYDRDGWNEDGRDEDGYDRDGRDEDGYDRDGRDEYGYNSDGYNADGYNADGYDEDGYNASGYDEDGYNADGYDEDGYDADGYDADGYDANGDYRYDSDNCCESPELEFAIRNDGCDPLKNDTRVTITLPAGTISREGIAAIRSYLYSKGLSDLAYDLEPLGDQWQTKNGNFTKRLSRHGYKSHQVKLTPEILSQVGCIARDHSTAVDIEIDVTRDLNQSAGYFYHEESCWWGGYYEGRCTLKTNGGFGMRSFNAHGHVSGRAWVMPLRITDRGELAPTFATGTADAFVVFNGYGELSNYAPARIMAHMAGWTYRKIGFSAEPMYINAGGYLIAPEKIAEKYTDGSLCLDTEQHSSLYYAETRKELISA